MTEKDYFIVLDRLNDIAKDVVEIKAMTEELIHKIDNISSIPATEETFKFIRDQLNFMHEAYFQRKEHFFKIILYLLSGSSILTFILERIW